MATEAQVAANQANAQKSTGPTSEEGKAASSQNRRTHGLTYSGGNFTVLACEDQADFDRLVRDLTGELEPTIPSEMLLIQRMAQSQWLRDRAIRLQEACFNYATGEIEDEKKLALYQRYANAHDRAFYTARKAYLSNRKLDQSIQIGFEREMRAQELHPFRTMQRQAAAQYLETRSDERKAQAARSQMLAEEETPQQNARQAA